MFLSQIEMRMSRRSCVLQCVKQSHLNQQNIFSSRSAAYDSRSSDKKRIDDYSASKRDDYKRDDYKRDPFKRPVSDYPKRDLESSRHTSSSSYDTRAVPVHRNDTIGSSSSKDRYAMTPSQSSFSSRVRDERDSR